MRRHLPPLPATVPSGYPRHRAVGAREARALDERSLVEHGLPSLVLMEHAARGVAQLADLLGGPGGRILVLSGPGNNGGDGYGAARHLASWGRLVRVLAVSARRPPGGDAGLKAALCDRVVAVEDALSMPGLLADALAWCDVIVDALFGVGLDRDLGPPYPEVIARINAAAGLRLAVDVPSGLDADSGLPRPVAVRADATAVMGIPKIGLVHPSPGAAFAGRIVEVDIGLPAPLHLPYAL